MAGTPTAFGIDFGTTNTRVAYFDGKKLRVIRFVAEADAGREYQIPTLVAYAAGEAVAFGHDAARQPGGVLPPRSIKWLLAEDGPVEVDGRAMDPVQIATDFFTFLRRAVGVVVRGEPLRSAALTIPVDYPPRARTRLQEACQRAGIEITHFFFEPVAALYCNLISRPTSGVAAVFDWGGGSLDIATVQIQDGVAMTRNIQGWHRGGEDFDRLICQQALEAFLREHPEFRMTAEQLLTVSERSRRLQRLAEQIKIRLSDSGSERLAATHSTVMQVSIFQSRVTSLSSGLRMTSRMPSGGWSWDSKQRGSRRRC